MSKKKGAGVVAPAEAVADYRHAQAKRKNNPPAKIAAEGIVPILPKTEYACSPRQAPELRFDGTGQADGLPELLETTNLIHSPGVDRIKQHNLHRNFANTLVLICVFLFQ